MFLIRSSRKFGRWAVALASLSLVSCASLNGSSDEEADEPSVGKVPDFLLSGGGMDDGVGTPIGRDASASGLDFSGLAFTDPDNPDKPIPELDQMFSEVTRDDWDDYFTRAKETAIREEKPMLLWFTDSERSPLCKRLENEVWRSNEFKKLADDRIVRVRFDFNLPKSETKKRNYLKAMKKQYKALGLPTVVILTADGQFVHQERGYVKGQSEFYYQQLKFRIEQAEQKYAADKARLKAQGYRNWKSRDGRTSLFAKPVGLKNGYLRLQRMDRERTTVKLEELSRADRQWVEEQVEKLGNR